MMLHFVEFVFWISGMLEQCNRVFVSGLGLDAYQFIHSGSHSFQYLHAIVCCFHAFGWCFLFSKTF